MVNVRRYQKLANRISDDHGLMRPTVLELRAKTMERMAGGPTPGFCDTTGDTPVICLRPDANDIVFFHEMAHFLGEKSEMGADMKGFDLEVRYLGKPRPHEEVGEAFRRRPARARRRQ